ncbi:hypothetical protein JHK87_017809 [Glycine soja]|nr:hypothetical protein JHK87_017809 [Glycine soja]
MIDSHHSQENTKESDRKREKTVCVGSPIRNDAEKQRQGFVFSSSRFRSPLRSCAGVFLPLPGALRCGGLVSLTVFAFVDFPFVHLKISLVVEYWCWESEVLFSVVVGSSVNLTWMGQGERERDFGKAPSFLGVVNCTSVNGVSFSVLTLVGRLDEDYISAVPSKQVLDVIVSSTNDLGPFSLDNFRKKLSASWRVGLGTSNARHELNQQTTHVRLEKPEVKEGRSSGDSLPQWTDSSAQQTRRHLIEKRREKRAAELVKKDNEVIVKLENTAIERSKSVESAILGKYNIWRKEIENENVDSTVRLMRDQIIMARVYLSIAKMKNKVELYEELIYRLKESQHALGDAVSDADLHRSTHGKIKAMGQVLSKAREQLYDCNLVTGKLRAMLQTADDQVRSLKKQSTFLSQLAAKTIPNGIHCLSLRLTIDYYLLPPEKRKFPGSENLENPRLYHYALFSDNVLAASVVVNSTIMNAKDPSKHVFHLVTDKLNFGAMNMWFLLNPPEKATIHVENVDDFRWLNSSYCPVLRQLESATLKEFYFKAGHPNSLSSGASNLKCGKRRISPAYITSGRIWVLWKLGTLPPGLITFYGLTHPLDKSWHVLGLGYNPSLDRSEIENAAVVHYNGNMKPWLEIAMTKYRSYWTKYVKYNHPYLRNCKLNE